MATEHSESDSPEILKEKYKIEHQLVCKGGRKTVLARDLTNNELVVIKSLTFGNDLTWEDLKLFEREAETLKAITHDFIPRYIDSFEIELEHNRGFALVQEYIEAPSIEERVQTGRSFSESELKELAIAILNILNYLHSLQPSIIHRDIKPSNILLGQRSGNSVGDLYLVDFGSVQNLATKKGGTITVVGTYGYMPPEQFGGRAKPASDLYSLGATLIYLITGQHPADLPENDLKIEFEQLANISPGLVNWLRKMTEPSLSRRYTNAKEALKELKECHLYNQQNFKHKKAVHRNINKPSNSQITLRKNANNFEIKIPPAGFMSNATYSNLAILFAFALFLRLLLPAFFLIGQYQPQGTPEYLIADNIMFVISLIVSSLSLISIITTIIFIIKFFLGIMGSMKLRISPQKISLVYQVLGIRRYSPKQGLRTDIYRLEKISLPDRTSYIRIWAKKRKYQISTNPHFVLTSLEVNWLAQELSKWLNLPIIEVTEQKRQFGSRLTKFLIENFQF